jgi:tetraacyldisaccharide-1-P 4'-kinase
VRVSNGDESRKGFQGSARNVYSVRAKCFVVLTGLGKPARFQDILDLLINIAHLKPLLHHLVQ